MPALKKKGGGTEEEWFWGKEKVRGGTEKSELRGNCGQDIVHNRRINFSKVH